MENRFTPYNPESPGLQTGDEGNFRSKDKEKLRPLGLGYTGFTIQSIERIFQHRFSFATRAQLLGKGRDSFQTIFDAVLAASYAGRAFFARLLRAGIEIYTYQGEMLHAKTYLFDQCWSIIGSTNLDYQSLMYNDEGNIGILGLSFASKMAGIFEEDLKNSAKIDEETWRKRSFLEKIKEHFFALFRKRL